MVTKISADDIITATRDLSLLNLYKSGIIISGIPTSSKKAVTHAAEILRKDFQLVDVRFCEDGKVYTYKANISLKLTAGDSVLVVDANQRKMLKAAAVASVRNASEIDLTATFDYKWIVGKEADILASYIKNVSLDNMITAVLCKASERQDRNARVGVVTDMVKQNLNAAERRELTLLLHSTKTTKVKRRR